MNQAHQIGSIRLRSAAPSSGVRQSENDQVEGEEDEIVSFSGEGAQHGREGNHFTKTGAPDRRYKGQRDLPDEEVQNVHYTRPAVGGVDEKGIHRTSDGRPDRRFLENRAMSATEAKIKAAEYLIAHREELLDESEMRHRDEDDVSH